MVGIEEKSRDADDDTEVDFVRMRACDYFEFPIVDGYTYIEDRVFSELETAVMAVHNP